MNTRFIAGLAQGLMPGLAVAIITLSFGLPALAGPRDAAPIGVDLAPASSYGQYLVGRYAMAQGDIGRAATALGTASTQDPTNASLREKAFLVALLDGDVERAQALTEGFVPQSDSTEQMSHLVSTVVAIKGGRYGRALKEIDAALQLDPGDRTATLMRPYVLALSGKWKAALADTGDAHYAKDDGAHLLVAFLTSERARIEELRGHPATAGALYESIYKPGAASYIFGPDYAGFLERQTRLAEARIVWQSLADAGDMNGVRALKRLGSPQYVPPALPDLRQSLAQALFLSATMQYSNQATEVALANLRLAIYLDPTSDRQRIFLGQIQQELKAPQDAESAWASVPSASPFYGEATLRRIWSLRNRDKDSDALDLLTQALVADPGNVEYVIEKASLLLAVKDPQGALSVIDQHLGQPGKQDVSWQGWYVQAMAYNSLNQWDKAEASIQKAREMEPNRPEILNFLGYGWINRGERINEGMALIRQALAINPKSGAIIDSLGWAFYMQGDYAQALIYIERAVQIAPSDPEINEHLGDVYKALGRHIEAGYEWQRVLQLDAGDAATERVSKKIEENEAVLRTEATAQLEASSAVVQHPATPLKRRGKVQRRA